MKKLTNKQMSLITGGEWWYCTHKATSETEMSTVVDPDAIGPSEYVEAATAEEAADKVHARTGSSQVNCTLARGYNG